MKRKRTILSAELASQLPCGLYAQFCEPAVICPPTYSARGMLCRFRAPPVKISMPVVYEANKTYVQ